jgi:hypothetical protein
MMMPANMADSCYRRGNSILHVNPAAARRSMENRSVGDSAQRFELFQLKVLRASLLTRVVRYKLIADSGEVLHLNEAVPA